MTAPRARTKALAAAQVMDVVEGRDCASAPDAHAREAAMMKTRDVFMDVPLVRFSAFVHRSARDRRQLTSA
jgi:hypothetical protein